MLVRTDTEEVAPSVGLTVTEHTLTSRPDGNAVNLRLIRPECATPLPCVYDIHGARMQVMPCYHGNYHAWGRILAAQGVAVAIIDFRKALVNDCVAGLEWLIENATALGIDRSHAPKLSRAGAARIADFCRSA